MSRKIVYIFLILLILIIGLELFILFRPKIQPVSKLIFACPVPAQYCQKGEIIKVDNKYFGLGFVLPDNISLYSVFSGQTKGGRIGLSQKIGGGVYPNIILTNFETKYEAVYNLTQNDYQGIVNVKNTSQIDRSRQGRIADFNYNLILKIYDKNNDNKLIEVDSSYFKP